MSGNLFLKNSSVILSAPRWKRPEIRTGMKELTVTQNVFSCHANPQFGSCERGAVLLDETGSRFGDVLDTEVYGNIVDADAGYRSTRARMKARVNASTSVQLDFKEALLFPEAALASGSAMCSLRDGPPVAFALRTSDPERRQPQQLDDPLMLLVEFGASWTGVVECTVDQSGRSRGAL